MNYKPIFRAREINTNEWVTGYYYVENAPIIRTTDGINAKNYLVDEKTLCSYTQSSDKNDVDIFEGDVVVLDGIMYVVNWNKCEWNFGHIDGQPYSYPYYATHCHKCEIIGNRYDNPNLLERNPEGGIR